MRGLGCPDDSAWMRLLPILVFALIPLAASAAGTRGVTRADLSYQAYALGLHILNLNAYFGLGPWNYQIDAKFRTTGLASLFNSGHDFLTVRGHWQDGRAAPEQFVSEGEWRGTPHRVVVDYGTRPEVRTLLPPNPRDREPVPLALQAGSSDLLSALATLVHRVTETGSCETVARVYDGRTFSILASRSAGSQVLARTGRSSFSGPALRCEFQGRVVAGFRAGHQPDTQRPTLHGSVWLADAMAPSSAPVPVRISCDTRWFGEITLYLTKAAPATGGYQQANSRY